MMRILMILLVAGVGLGLILLPHLERFQPFIDVVPGWLSWVLTAFGLLLLYTAYANYRHGLAIRAAELGPSCPAEIEIFRHDSGDEASYHARVSFRGERWRMPLMGDGAARKLLDNPGSGTVWCDPDTGKPMIIERDGLRPRTVPMIQRLD